MKRRISVNTYRLLDLAFFVLLLVLFENLIVRASRVWFADQLYTVSAVAAVTGIVMMRWGAWGLLHAAIGGLVFAAASGGSAEQIAIYALGNLFAAVGLLARKLIGRQRITGDGVCALVYAVIVQASMQAGRAAIAVLMGEVPKNCLGFFTTDSLSILFTMLILWIAGRQDGILEDQRDYLKRVHEQEALGKEAPEQYEAFEDADR